MLGQRQHTCSQKTSLQQCTDSFPDDRSFETYIAQLSHIDSICLYHMHDNFGVRTEELMHRLFETSTEALESSAAISSALSGVDKQLSSMDGVLSSVHQQQEKLGSLTQDNLAQSQLISTKVANIQGGLQAVQEAGDLLLERSSNTLKSIAELDAKELQRHRENSLLWQEARTDALAFHGALEAMRRKEQKTSEQLSSGLSDLTAKSEGLLERVNVAVELQQKANRVLVHILGAQYTLDDVVYYGAGLGTALLMSTQPATRAARLPVVALFLANWGTEQWLLGKLQRFLEVDAMGVVYAVVPSPRILSRALLWLHNGGHHAAASSEHQALGEVVGRDTESRDSNLRFRVKTLVRRACMGLALFATAWALLLHRRDMRRSRLRETQHDREVAEILWRMQRAERHERLMRAKLNMVLAELRGGRPATSVQLLDAPTSQERRAAARLKEGQVSDKQKGIASSEDQSPASECPGDSVARGNAPELVSPILRRPIQANSLPFLTAQQSVEPRHLPDSPVEGINVGWGPGQKQLSAGAGAVPIAGGADAGPQSGRAMSARRRLDFQAQAGEAALLSETDAAVEDPAAGSAAGEKEMDAEELPGVNDEDGSGGVVKTAGIPATAAGTGGLKRPKRRREDSVLSQVTPGLAAEASKKGRSSR
ncbi:g3414 [Coccomyxa elongata]